MKAHLSISSLLKIYWIIIPLSDSLAPNGEFRRIFYTYNFSNFVRFPKLSEHTEKFHGRIDSFKLNIEVPLLTLLNMEQFKGNHDITNVARYIRDKPLESEVVIELQETIKGELESNINTSSIACISYLYSSYGSEDNGLLECGIQYLCHIPCKIDGKYNGVIRVNVEKLAVVLDRPAEIVRWVFKDEDYFKLITKVHAGKFYHYRLFYVATDELNSLAEKIDDGIRQSIDSRIVESVESSEASQENSQEGEEINDNILCLVADGARFSSIISSLIVGFKREYNSFVNSESFCSWVKDMLKINNRKITSFDLFELFEGAEEDFASGGMSKLVYTNSVFPCLFNELYGGEFDEKLSEIIGLLIERKQHETIFKTLIMLYPRVMKNDIDFSDSIQLLIDGALKLPFNEFDVLFEVIIKIFNVKNDYIQSNYDDAFRMFQLLCNCIDENIDKRLAYCLFNLTTILLDFTGDGFGKESENVYEFFNNNFRDDLYSNSLTTREKMILFNFFSVYTVMNEKEVKEPLGDGLLYLLNDLVGKDPETDAYMMKLIIFMNDIIIKKGGESIFNEISEDGKMLTVFCDVVCKIINFTDSESYDDDIFEKFQSFYTNYEDKISDNAHYDRNKLALAPQQVGDKPQSLPPITFRINSAHATYQTRDIEKSNIITNNN